ncbi:MAG: methyl-accepting chemotaxis protein [Deltaproteobacteria bacterium]|nr:methyl-accepting chemotaxis protein [Deltaproteobacteria bacterium]
MKFTTKVLLPVAIACTVCSTVIVIVSALSLRDQGIEALRDKSSAILSRVEAARSFVGNQGFLETKINELVAKYPNKSIPEEEKQKLLNTVPIVGAMTVGAMNAEKEHYQFRVVAEDARNPKNTPTATEKEFLKKFEADSSIAQLEHVDTESNSLWVMRPNRIKKSNGCLVCHGNPATSPWGNGLDILGMPMENWKENTIHGMFKIVSDLTPMDEKVNASSLSQFGLALVILLLSAGLAIRSVKKPLSLVTHVAETLDQVGKGDLTVRAQVTSEDEIGAMGHALNSALSTMQKTVQSIGENSVTLSSAAEEMSAVSSQIDANARLTSQEADGVNNTAAQVNSNIDMVASSAEEMSSTIREIATNTAEAERVSKEAVQAAMVTNDIVTKLGESSHEIGNVINLINSVAEQTNLLALNATIEAARAGEAGKGFAVVANEVKELAKQTAKATEDIANRVETIQGETSKAVGAIKEITEIINQISGISHIIASAVEEQSVTTNEISRNVVDAAHGSADITKRIGEVSQAAQITTNGTNDTRAAASELAKMAAELKVLIGRFKY